MSVRPMAVPLKMVLPSTTMTKDSTFWPLRSSSLMSTRSKRWAVAPRDSVTLGPAAPKVVVDARAVGEGRDPSPCTPVCQINDISVNSICNIVRYVYGRTHL